LDDRNQGTGKALQRQIRRHVNAPEHRFLAVAPPELSPLCHEELVALGFPSAVLTPAGVEFAEKLRMAYAANLWLRTASRILCRVARFRAGAVEELFSHSFSFKWELWLPPAVPVSVEAHVERSRIEHEGAVERTVFRAIQRRLLSQGIPEPVRVPSGEAAATDVLPVDPLSKQRVLVHIEDNMCEISLDMTGGPLHQRGYRLRHAGAPLRETLAAAILMRSGWKGDIPLVDGMCGSGTFGVEAALLARRMPPAGRRAFLFQTWPSFEATTWAYTCRKAHEQSLPRLASPIVGVDRDSHSIEIAAENAERAGLGGDIRWEAGDFFEWGPERLGLPPGVVVLNPPYGKRLKQDPSEMYERVRAHLRKSFRGWHAVVLAPTRELAMKLKIPSARFWKVNHGGSRITVVFGRLA
jgi:putative N6-adenine-specific DNA methylase